MTLRLFILTDLINLLAQGWSLQDSVISATPMQSPSPGLPLSHVRVCCLVPSPHVALHGPKSLHWFQAEYGNI